LYLVEHAARGPVIDLGAAGDEVAELGTKHVVVADCAQFVGAWS